MHADREVLITPQRPPLAVFLNPVTMLRNLIARKQLIWQFTIREVTMRYRGTKLGLIWSFAYPLLMLTVYTFVFSVVFKVKWGVSGGNSDIEFALTMFCGMVMFQVFAECATRAPGLIVGNPSFVKKAVFPLEILPVAALGAALFHAAVSLLILICGVGIFLGGASVTWIAVPLVLAPVALLGLGVGWFLASLGVYLRDINQIIGVVLQILFFMTPIFYPISLVPQRFRWVLRINPLTEVVENTRKMVMWREWPDWLGLGAVTLLCAVAAQLGYAWFMKTKRGFADVV